MPGKGVVQNFFAVAEDLTAILATVEGQAALRYVQTGLFDDADQPIYSGFAALPSFGLAKVGESNQEATFLVLAATRDPVARPVAQKRGGTKYALDQLANPGTVVLRPGGSYGDGEIIAGMVGTVHDDVEAVALMNRFSAALRDRFAPIRSYLVGPAARRLFESGTRLTRNVNSSREYDLAT